VLREPWTIGDFPLAKRCPRLHPSPPAHAFLNLSHARFSWSRLLASILIVDDLSANRTFLAKLLRVQGHRLIEAVNGRDALAAVRAEIPDLVITDVLMPVMDGYRFVRELRLDPATARIPVLFYTAPYGEREARALARSSGVSYVLRKPAKPEELLKVVECVLSSIPLPAETSIREREADREHLRLLGDKLSEASDDLRIANARLRALINIGLDLASQGDSVRLLPSVCAAACDLFGATYATLGIIDLEDHTVRHFVACGTEVEDWIRIGDTVGGVLGAVVAEGRTLRGDNPGGDPAALQLSPLHPPVETLLAVPITSTAHVYGWICLVGNEGRSFTEEDEDLVTALAGQVGRFYELEHEIVERRQAESALRLERDRAQRYLDTAEVFLLKLDLEGRITLVNRYACAILGWAADELLGRDWISTCLPPRMEAVARKRFSDLLGGDSSIVDGPVLTRSGEERLVEWRDRLLHDEDGKLIGTFSSGADITARHQATDALRIAEERMRYALEAAAVGIWDMDYTTGVIRWSEILESQYGLAPGTFEGTFEAFVERIHPHDREKVRGTIAKAMKSGDDFSVEHRVILPDGGVRCLTGAGRVHLDRQGNPVRGLGISLDVSERHTLEAQYLQAQKMEAIGRLAGGVAHDFNNLLTAILGYCELLLADFEPDDPRQQDIAEIQKAGLSAAGLTRQLLAFSRKQIIEPTLLDVNSVVGDLKAILGRLIGEDVKVVMSLRAELPLIKADRGQMEQIVLNLAVNARDAMPDGGTLTVATGNVELDEEYANMHFAVKPGPYVMLEVTDTGGGMSPEVQACLFEPFFTTKEIGKGTGLGLATVHGIVTRCGGSVDVQSECGQGTSFKVYLPEADAEQVVSEAPPPVSWPRPGVHTVLVVEDAEGLRQLTKRLLERQGYTVLVASNADEALQVFEQNLGIDVLLTDVVMPGGSGPELNQRLIELRPTLKVIYMSGYTDEAIVHHGVLKPGIAFLQKPFTADALVRKICELLPGENGPILEAAAAAAAWNASIASDE
jgi:two-component system cell cycle sensor histidine kinase/response regulator CckA